MRTHWTSMKNIPSTYFAMDFLLFTWCIRYSTWGQKYMAQTPKGRFVQGVYKPIHRTCAMYFYLGVIAFYQGKFYATKDPPSLRESSQHICNQASDEHSEYIHQARLLGTWKVALKTCVYIYRYTVIYMSIYVTVCIYVHCNLHLLYMCFLCVWVLSN